MKAKALKRKTKKQSTKKASGLKVQTGVRAGIDSCPEIT